MKTAENNELSASVREAKKRDVISCFFSLLKRYPNEKIEDIFKRMENAPAPQYYATVENARRFIAIIAKGKKALPLTNERKRQMYFDIYKRWQEDCNKRGIEYLRSGGSFGYFANTSNITEDFLAKPASSFYLDFETMRQIVYRELKKKKNENTGE